MVEPAPVHVRISPAAAWRILIDQGLSSLRADLLGVQLIGLDIDDGASDVQLYVDQAVGTVPIRIDGGLSHLLLVRGATATALSLEGGAGEVVFDHDRYHGVCDLELETRDYRSSADRIDLRLTGGASRVAVVPA